MPYLDKVLLLLKKKDSISDIQISQKLHITKDEALSYVNRLCVLGNNIDIRDCGLYKIFSLVILLNLDLIRKNFTEKTEKYIKGMKLFNSISSTNEYFKQNISDVTTITIAEKQTAGRGRLGRQWLSPFGCNIYLSLIWGKWQDLHAIGGLSIIVGLSVIRTLERFSSNIFKLKWPNDVMWNNKKIAGILVDIVSKEQYSHAVIGIGINVNCSPNKLPQASCLKDIEEMYFNRNTIISFLLNDIFIYLDRYDKFGVKGFMKEWQDHDLLYNQNITACYNGEMVSGRSLGIDQEGRLIIEKTKTEVIYLPASECSICCRSTL